MHPLWLMRREVRAFSISVKQDSKNRPKQVLPCLILQILSILSKMLYHGLLDCKAPASPGRGNCKKRGRITCANLNRREQRKQRFLVFILCSLRSLLFKIPGFGLPVGSRSHSSLRQALQICARKKQAFHPISHFHFMEHVHDI